jgi:hypothetical protein
MKLKELKKKLSMPLIVTLLVVSAVVICTSGVLALFTNGGFEAGDLSGWTKKIGRSATLSGTPPFTESDINIIWSGGVDRTGATGPFATRSHSDANAGGDNLTYPFEGQWCAIINFQGSNNNANSLVQSSVTTAADMQGDGKIHVIFAWAAVMQNPGHPDAQQPYVFVVMKNLTKGTTLYDAFIFSKPTDPIFHQAANTVLYTDWQIMNQAFTPQQLAVGDTVQVECIAAGCSQGGHWGYLYVDGFGSIPPGPCPKPVVSSINPAVGQWQQTLDVTITGSSFTDAQAVSFGQGITVNSFTVDSDSNITANITITTGAVAARDVTVTTPCGSGKLTGGLMAMPLVPNKTGGSGGAGTIAAKPYIPPVFVVQNATVAASKAGPGEQVEVTATVTNNGGSNGTTKVILYVNGQEADSKGIALSSGQSTPVSFKVSRNDPGTYSVYVNGVSAGSFTVDLFNGNDMLIYCSVALFAIGLIGLLYYLMKRRKA